MSNEWNEMQNQYSVMANFNRRISKEQASLSLQLPLSRCESFHTLPTNKAAHTTINHRHIIN